MAPQEGWLALKLLEKSRPGGKISQKSFFISIPRKIVRRATERNRIRRVIREAIRLQPLPIAEEKVYLFQVRARPEKVGLETAKQALKECFE